MVSVDLRCCLYGHHHHHTPVSPQPKTAITVIAPIYPCRVSTGKVCDVRFRTDALLMGLCRDALRPILTVTCCTCSDQERTERKSERERESGVRERKKKRKKVSAWQLVGELLLYLWVIKPRCVDWGVFMFMCNDAFLFSLLTVQCM